MPTERGETRSVSSVARAAVAALCLAFAGLVSATPPLAVQRYSLEDGLSQQSVISIVQDSAGFMWFGTEDGLNRFGEPIPKLFNRIGMKVAPAQTLADVFVT